jgi:ubiquinone/menaquinone biosynthesis C-methylase UbiE
VTHSLPFDRIADSYDQTRGGEDRGRGFAGELARFLDRERLVLEVGVGTGVVALGLRELGFQVVGVDLSLPMLLEALRRIGPRLIQGDARRLPFADASIDQVCAVWVLHVVGDVGAVLREIGRVLRPKGRCVAVPAVGESQSDPIGAVLRTMQRGLDPHGIREDREERLRAFAPEAGLRVVARHAWPLHDYAETPAEALRKIEARSYSILWDVSDEQWERFVVPTIAALRALPPDEPVERTSTNEVVVMERIP